MENKNEDLNKIRNFDLSKCHSVILRKIDRKGEAQSNSGRLEQNKEIVPTDFEFEDEQNPEFKYAYSKAKKYDLDWLEGIERLGVRLSSVRIKVLENDLRDRIRIKLEMPPIKRGHGFEKILD